jgi:hypothetical protein
VRPHLGVWKSIFFRNMKVQQAARPVRLPDGVRSLLSGTGFDLAVSLGCIVTATGETIVGRCPALDIEVAAGSEAAAIEALRAAVAGKVFAA